MFMTHLKQACWIVWSLFNLAWLWALMCLLFFPASINNVSSALREPHDNCLLCGMTRAFECIARGHFHEALSLNRGSLYLFAFLSINLVVFITMMILFTRGKKIQPCNRSLLLGE
jgi:hypothetical protein